eukprot:354635-Chlamydomonas_euryale.AAC.6
MTLSLLRRLRPTTRTTAGTGGVPCSSSSSSIGSRGSNSSSSSSSGCKSGSSGRYASTPASLAPAPHRPQRLPNLVLGRRQSFIHSAAASGHTSAVPGQIFRTAVLTPLSSTTDRRFSGSSNTSSTATSSSSSSRKGSGSRSTQPAGPRGGPTSASMQEQAGGMAEGASAEPARRTHEVRRMRVQACIMHASCMHGGGRQRGVSGELAQGARHGLACMHHAHMAEGASMELTGSTYKVLGTGLYACIMHKWRRAPAHSWCRARTRRAARACLHASCTHGGGHQHTIGAEHAQGAQHGHACMHACMHACIMHAWRRAPARSWRGACTRCAAWAFMHAVYT